MPETKKHSLLTCKRSCARTRVFLEPFQNVHVSDMKSCIAALMHFCGNFIMELLNHNHVVAQLTSTTCKHLSAGKAGQSPAGVKENPPSRRKASDLKKGSAKDIGSIPRTQKVLCC